jgi:hypothetical protein
MKPPVPLPPGRQNEEEVILPTGGFRPAALASVAALVFLLLAGTLAWLRFSIPAPAAPRADEAVWLTQEAAQRQRLRGDPRDDRARLQLATALIGQARLEAQRAYPAERAATPADAVALEDLSAASVRSSPRLVEARWLAEAVARHGRDRRQRGPAWALLSTIERLEGDDEGAMACMEAAAREDPSYREDLACLKAALRACGGAADGE